ncbi:hypothetical protein CCGE531_15445 [Rhizobium sp. CCGE531]|nr:hypothetical protein CCGE531_15445 [Rhizobium sp. CCGE531]AYG73649.1 hypothetical protein CCGE532_14950 [Rhizobium sp. CCGE532]
MFISPAYSGIAFVPSPESRKLLSPNGDNGKLSFITNLPLIGHVFAFDKGSILWHSGRVDTQSLGEWMVRALKEEGRVI